MIIKFKKFLNEFRGPFTATGFKPPEPSDKFKLNLILKYEPKNEELLKNILSKHSILFDDFNLSKIEQPGLPGLFGPLTLHKLDLTFLSHNEFEASSIVNSIAKELTENNVPVDPTAIMLEPMNKTERRPIGFNRASKKD